MHTHTNVHMGNASQLVAKLKRYTVTRPHIHLMCTLVLSRAGKCIRCFSFFVNSMLPSDDNEHHHRSAIRFFMNGMFGMRTLVCVVLKAIAWLTHIQSHLSRLRPISEGIVLNEIKWMRLMNWTWNWKGQKFLCLVLFNFHFSSGSTRSILFSVKWIFVKCNIHSKYIITCMNFAQFNITINWLILLYF